MRFVVSVLFASLLMVLQATGAAAQTPAEVRAFVRNVYVHGVPYGEARALGSAAVPTLGAMLADDGEKPHWSNVVETIAYIGAPAGWNLLRTFVQERFEGEVDLATFRALIAAQNVLGHIAAGGDAAFVAELEAGCDPAYWSRLQWSYQHYSGPKLHLLWSKLTINALASTGTEAANSTLTRLEGRPYSEAQRSNIEEGRQRNMEIMAIGLENFELSRRARYLEAQ